MTVITFYVQPLHFMTLLLLWGCNMCDLGMNEAKETQTCKLCLEETVKEPHTCKLCLEESEEEVEYEIQYKEGWIWLPLQFIQGAHSEH